MRIVLIAWGAVLWGCPAKPVNTGARVTVIFEGMLTELSIDGYADDHSMIGPSKTFAASASPFEATVYVNDALAGSTILLRASAPGAAGEASFVVEKGRVVDVGIALITGCTSHCTLGVCGNGVRDEGEACDDNNAVAGDGCTACAAENGWDCTGTVCILAHCGDGVLDTGEQCDDGNATATDGCNACRKDGAYACTGEPSDCVLTSCGNGVAESAEGCDDGGLVNGDGCDDHCAVEAQWACAGSPLSCCKRCGDGVLQCDEVCDGDPASRCLAQGYLRGAGSDACNATCSALDTASCTGGEISSQAAIVSALEEAASAQNPGHDIIALRGGSITLDSTLSINESSASTSFDGVTLRPFSSTVTIERAIIGFLGTKAIEILSPGNRILGLTFHNFVTAISLSNDENNLGDNTIEANHIYETSASTSARHILIESTNNRVIGNRIDSDAATSANDYAIKVDAGAATTTIQQNVISGRFARMLEIGNLLPTTYVDQNTFYGQSGTDVYLSGFGDLCIRNNVLAGPSGVTGWEMTANVTPGGACGTSGFASNYTYVSTPCAGTGATCSTHCGNSGGLCKDTLQDPGLNTTSFCPGTDIADFGLDLGLDLDFSASTPNFTANAPPVGARDSAMTNHYGDLTTTCP